jgi:hypothetical protein
MDSKEKAILIMKACGQTLYTDELSDMKFLIEEGYDASEICNYLDVSKREYRETIQFILEGNKLEGREVEIIKDIMRPVESKSIEKHSIHKIVEAPEGGQGNYLKSVWIKNEEGTPIRLYDGVFKILDRK